jgi:CsoR family transcriptional regulator, copper-sensing transcriptional repressor
MIDDPVLHQLNRIKGQVDGITAMYESDRSCVEIVRQVMAARSSLGRVARDLLTCEASRCHRNQKVDELDDILKEVFRF